MYTGMQLDCVCKTTDKFEKQADSMAILNIGSRGMIERGFLNPLLEYAVRNGTMSERLEGSRRLNCAARFRVERCIQLVSVYLST